MNTAVSEFILNSRLLTNNFSSVSESFGHKTQVARSDSEDG